MDGLPTHEPLLKISDVAEATGVAPALLRAWERRYGFPETARTAGGQRLYSVEELDRIRRVQGLVAGGLAVSQAVAAVRCPGWVINPDLAPIERGGDICASIVDALYGALIALRGDEADVIARHVIAQSCVVGFVDQVLVPTMRRIGEDWVAGVVGIDQEHFAASWASSQLARQLSGLGAPTRERLLLACVDNEQHCLGLQALHVGLASAGYEVILLGASVPTPALLASVRRLRPAAVLLSVTVAANISTVEAVVAGVGDLPRERRPAVAYGGPGVQDAAEVRGACWLGACLADVIETLPGWLLIEA